ncbi:MAG: acyl-CoA desaturase [Phycisphaeraceae bacterium]|nr:acyl-CoA desaturase [Phycisphaeraceae bacterium]
MQRTARTVIGARPSLPARILAWLDAERSAVDVTRGGGVDADATPMPDPVADRIDILRCLPFIGLHLACGLVFIAGFSWAALTVAVLLYLGRMFAITGFYHRYFSHRTFRTSRAFQLVMAIAGAAAAQRGPLWWAGHHRHHHNHSDDDRDTHSPARRGFWMAHMGWFMTPRAFSVPERLVRDWVRYPELRMLDRFDWVVPVLLAAACFALGVGLDLAAPGLGTSGFQVFVWGFIVSTVCVYHATYTINSLAHRWGRQRFATGDDSRNNMLLALVTLGEGWHNNHHHFPASTRQGFYWWEIDLTYYGLVLLRWLGLIWDLRPVPAQVLERSRAGS